MFTAWHALILYPTAGCSLVILNIFHRPNYTSGKRMRSFGSWYYAGSVVYGLEIVGCVRQVLTSMSTVSRKVN